MVKIDIKQLLGLMKTIDKWDYFGLGLRIMPTGSCEHCPFGAKTREAPDDILNDPSEAHYICPLLGEEVWGEDPKCEQKLTELFLAKLKELYGIN